MNSTGWMILVGVLALVVVLLLVRRHRKARESETLPDPYDPRVQKGEGRYDQP